MGDPYTAIIGAGLSAAQAAPAGPSQAHGGSIGGDVFDSGSWNVSFGNSKLTADQSEREDGGLTPYLPYVVVGAVFLLAWRYLKK